MLLEKFELQLDAPGLQVFVFGPFLIFGGITSLNDVIIPKLKELFTLTKSLLGLILRRFQACSDGTHCFALSNSSITSASLVCEKSS